MSGDGLRPLGVSHFRIAKDGVRRALQQLHDLRADYRDSPLPERIKRARMEALDAKIDALEAVQLDGTAHPWSGDR